MPKVIPVQVKSPRRDDLDVGRFFNGAVFDSDENDDTGVSGEPGDYFMPVSMMRLP
jgi:hypothetical protein